MNVMLASASAFNLDTSKFVLISLHEPMLGFIIVDCISYCKICIKGTVKCNNLKFGFWIFSIRRVSSFPLLLCFQQKIVSEESLLGSGILVNVNIQPACQLE